MIAVTPRLKWVVPLLVLMMIVALLVVVTAQVARGETATTLPTTAAAPSTDEAEGSAVFKVAARDVGVFSSQPPALVSPAAIVVNAATGRVLYERDATTRRPMASTTKIMTAMLVLEALPLDRMITVSEKAGRTYEPKALLRPGDRLTVQQLLYALTVRSSNGAAVALAEAVDGSEEAFVEHMNDRAERMGLADTHFANPHGLDAEGHYSTAADMAALARAAMTDEVFCEFVNTRSYSLALPGRDAEKLVNTNKLLTWGDWVTGVKTGLTPRAEQCLVASASRDGVSVISVVLGQPSSDICWNESGALLEYGLRQYRHLTLMQEGTAVAQSTVPYHADGTIRLVTTAPVEIELYKDDEVTALVSLDRPLELPVDEGERYGRVLLSVAGETVASVDVVADRSFAEVTLGSKIAYYWDRLTGWLGG